MRQMRAEDAKWKDGKTFSLVYFAGEDVSSLLKDAYGEFMAENGLSPLAFPSLRRFEAEVVKICVDLFHGDDEACGSMTSGGSESVMMAVKTARDWARAKGIAHPEMILPSTIHPVFEKAGHYFDVKIHHAPIGPDFRVDVAAVEKLINPNTALIVGSAMPYPHGVVDPITELAALAQRKGLLCHVDACLGGFILPFAKKLGRDIPPFDFEVPGVTSISADLHKYGFAAKGASVVLYKTHALRKHQFFTFSEWSGGLYISPTMTGTRPGGAIAAAWAVLHYLGEDGYLKTAKALLDTTQRLMDGICSVPGMKILGKPHGSVFAWNSDRVDVYQLGDAMEARGWKLDRQQKPPALHCMVTPAHEAIVEPFLADLKACVASLQSGEPAPEGSAAMYGMVGTVPKETADSFLVDFLDGLYEA
jgi:glutamate/tyrosine decarboxylase-like PLP-dependent enzyme